MPLEAFVCSSSQPKPEVLSISRMTAEERDVRQLPAKAVVAIDDGATRKLPFLPRIPHVLMAVATSGMMTDGRIEPRKVGISRF
jgi:hypothetical protein